MPVVYNDTSVLFRRHASDDSWHQAVLTVSELESGLHLLMVSGKHQGLATQHDLQRNDLLVALIHNAWIMNMDEGVSISVIDDQRHVRLVRMARKPPKFLLFVGPRRPYPCFCGSEGWRWHGIRCRAKVHLWDSRFDSIFDRDSYTRSLYWAGQSDPSNRMPTSVLEWFCAACVSHSVHRSAFSTSAPNSISLSLRTALNIDEQTAPPNWPGVYLNRRRFPKQLLEEDRKPLIESRVEQTHSGKERPLTASDASNSTTGVQHRANSPFTQPPPFPSPHFEPISPIPTGRYSLLLLPDARSAPRPFTQFNDILTRGGRTMFYVTAECNPNGFETVVPMVNHGHQASHGDQSLQQTVISSPPSISSAMNRFKPITSTRITSPLSDDEVRQKFALEPTAGGGRAQSLPPLSVTSRPATRSSLRRTTRFSSPTSDSSGSAPTNLDPIEDKRAFRTSTDGGDEGGYTIWYHTQAPYSLTTPRTLPSPPTPGAVYVHTDTNNGSKQVWVWTTSVMAYRAGLYGRRFEVIERLVIVVAFLVLDYEM
ncbi:hypothetical protein BC629DRAFT_1443739 [Irpex lacteus]|nr:hypothetical protein BC629DRAFT_1443739 [Irpex lacteus]